LPAGGEFRVDAEMERNLTVEELKSALNEGNDRLYVVSIITYFDVFKRVRHTTRFCAYITPSGKTLTLPNGKRALGYEWALANVHNDAT
jgi:hypothetical protein